MRGKWVCDYKMSILGVLVVIKVYDCININILAVISCYSLQDIALGDLGRRYRNLFIFSQLHVNLQIFPNKNFLIKNNV